MKPESLSLALALTPHGRFYLETRPDKAVLVAPDLAERLQRTFEQSSAQGMFELAGRGASDELPPSLAFGREFARQFLLRLAQVPDLEEQRDGVCVPVPMDGFETLAERAPPMTGAEYLSREVLETTWRELEHAFRDEIIAQEGSVQDWLRARDPVFNIIGRVCFHLAENKTNREAPFAFLSTYATRLSDRAKVQHLPLSQALRAYAGDRAQLLTLLLPVKRAAEESAFMRKLVDSGEVFHPLAWTPDDAFQFLRDVAVFEAAGVVVRVPDWWKARRPPRPEVSVTIGSTSSAGLSASALLDFSARLTLDGETLTEAEISELLATTGSLALLKGRWVEVDREKLSQILAHWKSVAKVAEDGVSFLDGMRLLAGVPPDKRAQGASLPDGAEAWSHIAAGDELKRALEGLRNPETLRGLDPGDDLRAELRPYQKVGLRWLWHLERLGLGGCLADDMGLGKTIQVLSLLLLLKKREEAEGVQRSQAAKAHSRSEAEASWHVPGPHLLVVPASLIANWLAEIERFAPSLRAFVAHPSAAPSADLAALDPKSLKDKADLVITTYGALHRFAWIREAPWGTVILDEAQAIKNPETKQARAAKALKSRTRLALTGTPIENRLSDLWSLFDFVLPGLLGSAKVFGELVRKLGSRGDSGFAPLRDLVRPYILRRLKSDKRIIDDLPDKTEVRAFCPLTKTQAAMYQQAVDDLSRALKGTDGMKRRGIVLSSILRMKQICNHPSQSVGHSPYAPAESGKFARLGALSEEIASRQEKVLVFTQFKEITEPLAAFLETVFGRHGLVLHGEIPVKKRKGLVDAFQNELGPPFFVLSVKAGGTGLNLTAASHVIHFDRWWNPAVEDQATDRAYRIGQKRNVLVHKFVCRGTVEEKIDDLIAAKRSLSTEILEGGGEMLLTEMSDDALLSLVSLDIHSALAEV